MANWTYNANDYQEHDYSIIPEGNYRVRIDDVVEKVFRSGNEGYEIVLEVSGHSGKLWYYLVLDRSNEQMTNQKIGAFFSCFGITNTALGNGQQWIGKVGGARVKHEEYNGSTRAKVHYLLSKSKQDELPPWQGKVATAQPVPVEVSDDELPF